MKKKDKELIIDKIVDDIKNYSHFYLTDIATLNAQKTTTLRKECVENDIKLLVVKNTILKKALERLDGDYSELYPLLKGNTAMMFSNAASGPAKLIQKHKDDKIPSLKGAYVQECFFIGEQTLGELVAIKSKEELIGDIIALLQSPAKNVISALSSGGQKLHGILQTLSEK